MAKMVGYMITWTSHGTWLQGDRRGYVKNGKILKPNAALENANKQNQTQKNVWLSEKHQVIVKKAIVNEAKKLKQRIYAIAVGENHVHIVAKDHPAGIKTVVARYKNAARQELYKVGFAGRVWTKGYDKRYCFTQDELKRRIEYVERHNKPSV